jgi:hypothetical protein
MEYLRLSENSEAASPLAAGRESELFFDISHECVSAPVAAGAFFRHHCK